MTGHEQHAGEHGAAMDDDELDAAVKNVADAIEDTVDMPSSIEEQAMLEAAELGEIETG